MLSSLIIGSTPQPGDAKMQFQAHRVMPPPDNGVRLALHLNTVQDAPHANQALLFLTHALPRVSAHESAIGYQMLSRRQMDGVLAWGRDCDDEEAKDDTYHTHAFALSYGTHRVRYEEDTVLEAHIQPGSNEAVHLCASNKTRGKDVLLTGFKDAPQMERFLNAAVQYVLTTLLRTPASSAVRHYLYEAENRILVRLGHVPARERASLFLKAGDADRLFGAVADFLTSKADYRKTFVPYKLNVLLHGLPGGGKTSLISAVASEFGLRVLIVPFTTHLTDHGLANALTLARARGVRLIALEDVDCLFEEKRKQHDASLRCGLTLSGLLNCMDGMLRAGADGMLMFLTANLTSQIDEALLRSARIDVRLAFTHTDEFQARACLAFYTKAFAWPAVDDAAWATFWDGVHYLRFSTATLQQFFFAQRHSQAHLSVEAFKAMVRSETKADMTEADAPQAEKTKGLYA
jgi:hypothetical protein